MKLKLEKQQLNVKGQIVIDVECQVLCNENYVDRHFHDAVEGWLADVDVELLEHFLGGEIEDGDDVVCEVTDITLKQTKVTSVEAESAVTA